MAEAFVLAVVLLLMAGAGWCADQAAAHAEAEGGDPEVKNRRAVHERRIHGSQQAPAPKPSK
jgi:hypothetical protein